MNKATDISANDIIKAILRSGFDLSPCRICGLPVVCIPDGLPVCEKCGRAESDATD